MMTYQSQFIYSNSCTSVAWPLISEKQPLFLNHILTAPGLTPLIPYRLYCSCMLPILWLLWYLSLLVYISHCFVPCLKWQPPTPIDLHSNLYFTLYVLFLCTEWCWHFSCTVGTHSTGMQVLLYAKIGISCKRLPAKLSICEVNFRICNTAMGSLHVSTVITRQWGYDF